jgi:hypothetical protein
MTGRRLMDKIAGGRRLAVTELTAAGLAPDCRRKVDRFGPTIDGVDRGAAGCGARLAGRGKLTVDLGRRLVGASGNFPRRALRG